MKKQLFKGVVLALVLILCMSLFGCEIVTSQEQVLLNPTEGGETTTTAGDVDVDEPETDATDDEPEQDGGETTTTKKQEGGKTTSTTKKQQSSGNTEKKLSGTLEIQCWTNENRMQTEVFTRTFEMFEKATGVKVKAHVGSQVNQAMTKRWVNGNPPDIAYLSGSGIPDVALEDAGALYDCTDIIENGYVYGTNTKIMDKINPNMIERTDDGRIMRPPTGGGSVYGYWYDTAYMKQLGLQPPKTYNELMKFADAVIKKGTSPYTCYGMSGSYNGWAMVWPSIAQELGQKKFDEFIKGTKAGWSEAGVKKIYTRWQNFITKEGVLTKGAATWDHTTSQMKWLQHQGVLIANGEWLPWEMETSTPAGFTMEFVGCPMGDDGDKPSVVVIPGRMILPTECKNMENAQAFLRFLYRDDVPKISDLVNASTSTAMKQCQEYQDSGKCDVYYKRYDWGDLNTETGNSVHGILTGDIDAATAIKNVINKTTK
ncbi:MAG: extracellular solute-binding protein [Clostridia bacterium]|nr:extracellular solute-binding protein [Clostridia bacterium]